MFFIEFLKKVHREASFPIGLHTKTCFSMKKNIENGRNALKI
jgi:hypothetical protein